MGTWEVPLAVIVWADILPVALAVADLLEALWTVQH